MKFNVNNEENQFELTLDNGTGIIEYSRKGDSIYLTHTEVPAQMQGKGVATKLVEHTLNYIKSHNLTVVPMCSFVRKFMDNHEEYHDLLSEGYRM
ncbi:MAG: N-acetyltransferase [Proteobacteria bacterium]|nr:MAG: N-acetyltransferase [Pseudomonadota bacterium]